MSPVKLKQFKAMTPRQQVYYSYMQAEWPSSELKSHQSNPYPAGTAEHREFIAGQQIGVLEAQDSEE